MTSDWPKLRFEPWGLKVARERVVKASSNPWVDILEVREEAVLAITVKNRLKNKLARARASGESVQEIEAEFKTAEQISEAMKARVNGLQARAPVHEPLQPHLAVLPEDFDRAVAVLDELVNRHNEACKELDAGEFGAAVGTCVRLCLLIKLAQSVGDAKSVKTLTAQLRRHDNATCHLYEAHLRAERELSAIKEWYETEWAAICKTVSPTAS